MVDVKKTKSATPVLSNSMMYETTLTATTNLSAFALSTVNDFDMLVKSRRY